MFDKGKKYYRGHRKIFNVPLDWIKNETADYLKEILEPWRTISAI